MLPAFILDDEATWPNEPKRILEQGLSTLRAFWEEDRRIERLQQGDVLLRIYQPQNPHQQKKDEIYDTLGRALTDLYIVGWHCTRLCDDEIELLLSGMYPLSPATFTARLERRVRAGDISAEVAQRLANEHDVNNPHRQMLWFIFSRNSLQDAGGVQRLFTFWGGEALYGCHEEDVETGPLLRSIGKPCIVEAELPIRRIEARWEPAQWIARPFLYQRGISDGHSPKRDGHIREPIGPERIRRVIQFGDPDFETLTAASTWRTPLKVGKP
jgi:hypothetical protein